MKNKLSIFVLGIMIIPSVWALDTDTLYFSWGKVKTSKPEILGTFTDLKTPEYFIIQFKGPIFEHQKKAIQKRGAKLLSYLPMNAFVVSMSPRAYQGIRKLPFVKWVGQYKKEYRFSPQYHAITSKNKEEAVKLLVQFFSTVKSTDIIKLFQARNIQILEDFENGVKVLGKRKELHFLETLDDVEWLGEDLDFDLMDDFVPPYDALTGYEPGNKIVDPDPLHLLDITGKTQILAYSDTGLDNGMNDDTLHPDFRGRIHAMYAPQDGDGKDVIGHGTHIGGLLVGNGASSQQKIKASSFEAKLIVQSLSVQGRIIVPVKVGPQLLAPAYQHGARIHSNSWASRMNWATYSPYTKSVDQFVWENPDMLVVFSAGNAGADFDKNGIVDERSILIPGDCKNCLSVGASENLVLKGGAQINWQWIGVKDGKWDQDPIASDFPSNNAQGIAAFSSRGPTVDGRIKPDIVAPGTNILSTKSRISGSSLWAPYNSDYTWSGGTSTSAPIVASGLALVREYLIQHKKIESPSSALLKALALNGAVDLYPGQFGDIEKKEIPTKRPNMQEGWGLFNIPRCILETDKRKIIFFDEKTGLSTSQKKEYFFNVKDVSEPIRVTLLYPDFPSALNRGRYLVNDLDLEIEDEFGKKYFPNHKETKDDVNNIEGIDIFSPVVGGLKIAIHAFNVPEGGKQRYALVISGGISEN